MTAASPYSAYRDRRYFGSLDGLRCLCILLVLWHHKTPIFGPDPELPRLLTRGFTGVDFFFVLSGFLITTLLLREEARNGRFSIRGFYRRRFLRIVPLYFLVITLISLWWILVRGQEQWIPYAPYYYLFLSNFLTNDIPLLAPTWSLSVEEQYYLIWPALLLLVPVLRLRFVVLVGLISLAVLISQGILPSVEIFPETEVARFVLPTTSYSAILIGSLTGLLLHHPVGFSVAWRVLSARFVLPALLGALIVSWQVLPAVLTGWPNLVMHSLMALILTSLVIREDHAFAPLLRWRPIVRLGMISYGLYLWHLIGRHIGVELASRVGFDGVAAAWVALPIYLVSSVVIAEISFRYYESYFLRLKDKKSPATS